MNKVNLIYQTNTKTGETHLHSLCKYHDDNDKKAKQYIIGLYHAIDDPDPQIEYTYQTWQVRG